jgi:hypothetical protein
MDWGDRFARLTPAAAGAILAAVLGLILLGLLGGGDRIDPQKAPPANDHALYVRVIDDVHRGESYYPAAVREQRQGGYPLRPFLTVRPPTLALAMATLPGFPARKLAIELMSAAVVGAWAWRLHRLGERVVGFSMALFLVGASAVPAFIDHGYSLHELWGGDLIALSLALYDRRWWPVSLALGLVALSLRELAAPFVLAMGAMALRERRPGEAVAWAFGLVGFAIALAVHAGLVAPLVRPGDPASPGWLALGGWKRVLTFMKWNGVLFTAPNWPAAVLAPLVLLGLAGAGGPLADRIALVVVGYTCAFMIVGRTDNAYWGLMIAPIWPIGLISTGTAARTLLGRLGALPARVRTPSPARSALS